MQILAVRIARRLVCDGQLRETILYDIVDTQLVRWDTLVGKVQLYLEMNVVGEVTDDMRNEALRKLVKHAATI